MLKASLSVVICSSLALIDLRFGSKLIKDSCNVLFNQCKYLKQPILNTLFFDRYIATGSGDIFLVTNLSLETLSQLVSLQSMFS